MTRGLPKARRASNDRAPTIDEIRKVTRISRQENQTNSPYTMASSGIRLGAWDLLQWKHRPILNENGEIIAAKLIVYAGDIEEYYSFITTEAYNALKDWIDFRSSK